MTTADKRKTLEHMRETIADDDELKVFYADTLTEIDGGGNADSLLSMLKVVTSDFIVSDVHISFDRKTKTQKVERTGDTRPVTFNLLLWHLAVAAQSLRYGENGIKDFMKVNLAKLNFYSEQILSGGRESIAQMFDTNILNNIQCDIDTFVLDPKPPAIIGPDADSNSVTHRPVTQQFRPLDKVNSNILSIRDVSIESGKTTANDANFRTAINITSKAERRKGIAVQVCVDLAAVDRTTLENLSAYDKKILSGIYSICNDDSRVIDGKITTTANELFKITEGAQNGISKRTQTQKILDSVRRMAMLWFQIDNTQESQQRQTERIRYEGNFLRADIVTRTINGKITANALLIEVPVLFRYAKAAKQFTTLPVSLNGYPGTHTDLSDSVHSYLLQRIAHMNRLKNKRLSHKILFSTLLDNTTTPKAETRQGILKYRNAVKYIARTILVFFKDNYFIGDFTMNDYGDITIFRDNQNPTETTG